MLLEYNQAKNLDHFSLSGMIQLYHHVHTRNLQAKLSCHFPPHTLRLVWVFEYVLKADLVAQIQRDG